VGSVLDPEGVFPEAGTYVFPDGLATVRIDREADHDLYYEPNVWLIHDVPATGGL
jgi:hypothetical protein